MVRELWAALADSLRYGDLSGHLMAWLSVVRGEVKASHRYELASDVEGKMRAILQELSPMALSGLHGLLRFYIVCDDLPREEVDAIRDVVQLALERH